jgi:hypothetical protein
VGLDEDGLRQEIYLADTELLPRGAVGSCTDYTSAVQVLGQVLQVDVDNAQDEDQDSDYIGQRFPHCFTRHSCVRSEGAIIIVLVCAVHAVLQAAGGTGQAGSA